MSTGTTTLGALADKLEQQTQAAQQTSNTSVAENGALQTPAPSQNGSETPSQNGQQQPTVQPEATPATEQSQEDISTTAFNLGEEETQTPAPEQATPQQSQPVYNWKDELKKADKNEVLKEIGLNDFVIGLNDHISRGGTAADYIAARGIDYNKVSDENLIKDDLKKQYPNLSPSQIDLMYSRQYQVSEDALDEDKDFYNAKLQADAYKVRQNRIAEQKQFKMPEAIPVKDEMYDEWKSLMQNQEKITKEINDFYSNHEATKALNESKRVTISLGDGVPPLNFTVNRPDVLTKSFVDGGETWRKVTSTKTGEPNVPKQQKIALFSFDPEQYERAIFNYGKAIGRQSLVAEGQNARKPNSNVSDQTQNSKPTYSVGKFGDKLRD